MLLKKKLSHITYTCKDEPHYTVCAKPHSETFGAWLFSPPMVGPPDVLPPRIVHCDARATSMDDPPLHCVTKVEMFGGPTVGGESNHELKIQTYYSSVKL